MYGLQVVLWTEKRTEKIGFIKTKSEKVGHAHLNSAEKNSQLFCEDPAAGAYSVVHYNWHVTQWKYRKFCDLANEWTQVEYPAAYRPCVQWLYNREQQWMTEGSWANLQVLTSAAKHSRDNLR